MKYCIFAFSLSLSFGAFAQALQPPHMDLEMSSEEYIVLLSKEATKTSATEDPRITKGLMLGTRLLKWIELINTKRSSTNTIRLTSKDIRGGATIDAPTIYSPAIIEANTTKILASLPLMMREVLESEIDLPPILTLDDETFIKHARLVDLNYKMSARYKTVENYRAHFTARALSDVRGYYYLTKENYTSERLRDISLISVNELPVLKQALIGICQNNFLPVDCDKEVEDSFSNNTLGETFNRYYPGAEKQWRSFFEISSYGTRSDVIWINDVMTVPFNKPESEKFQNFLRDNIEDEFRFGAWVMKLNFGVFDFGPRLVLKPGVTASVNGVGGNLITMDSNMPFEEYASQWTIRHEFGHVVGLPDCYHEFYDKKLDAYVNYQLDTTDLMCSRAGNMTERIYKQLEKVYKKN